MKKAGVEAKLQVIKDNGHGGPGFNTPESKKLIEEFFDKHLKGKEAGGKRERIAAETARASSPLPRKRHISLGRCGRMDTSTTLAALNERFRKGVTPENNAAVLLWQAMGPGEIDPETRTRYFKMLDMKPLPETGDYFVTIEDYVRSLKGAEAASIPQPTDESPDPMQDQVNEAAKHPWSKKEYPVLTSWLAANETPLVLVVAGVEKTSPITIRCLPGTKRTDWSCDCSSPPRSRRGRWREHWPYEPCRGLRTGGLTALGTT